MRRVWENFCGKGGNLLAADTWRASFCYNKQQEQPGRDNGDICLH